jgi:hypothetical protein
MTSSKDAENHSMGSEEERRRRRKKRIPSWARGTPLSTAVMTESRDPDTIFEAVRTINLDAVFSEHEQRRFRPRTSSGIWVGDRLTAQEELDYKKSTGFL